MTRRRRALQSDALLLGATGPAVQPIQLYSHTGLRAQVSEALSLERWYGLGSWEEMQTQRAAPLGLPPRS